MSLNNKTIQLNFTSNLVKEDIQEWAHSTLASEWISFFIESSISPEDNCIIEY